MFGPFEGVSVAGLRAALASMHAVRPEHPAVCLLDRRAGRWRQLSTVEFAAHVEDAVIAVGEPTADAVARHLVGVRLADRPLVLAVGGGFVGLKLSHAVGDGRVVNAVLPALIRAAARRVPAQQPPPSGRLPLVRAALHHFGRHPGRVPGALVVSRPPGDAPGDAVEWRADPDYVSIGSTNALTDIRSFRDRRLPGVSTAAIQFAALAAALERTGLPPRGPGVVVLVDAWRYLPAGYGADGNFSWGLYLRPASLTDPKAVHEALTTQLYAGSALAALALRTGRLLLSPGAPPLPAPDRVPAEPRPRLSLTHIGRLDAYLDLPWACPPEQRRNISVPTTSGPEAITASFSELAGVLHLNLSFHRSTFDSRAVREAAELACRHPVQALFSRQDA